MIAENPLTSLTRTPVKPPYKAVDDFGTGWLPVIHTPYYQPQPLLLFLIS